MNDFTDEHYLDGSDPLASDLSRAIVLISEALDQLSYIPSDEAFAATASVQEALDILERYYEYSFNEPFDEGEESEFSFIFTPEEWDRSNDDD